MALEYLTTWEPFRIDALGLVTIIGAEEVDKAIGRLVLNPWVEYMPLLGSYLVAANRFVHPIPGMVMYNISDGVMATDVSGWLARWLIKQNPQWNITLYIWSFRNSTLRAWPAHLFALLLGIVINGGLLGLTAIVGDWFGLANTAALIASIFVRQYMLIQNRKFLDNVAKHLDGTGLDYVKVLCSITDGRVVTLLAPRGLVTKGFLTTPKPFHLLSYRACRAVGWLAFGFHVICIGQATLLIQVVTVVIMAASTVICTLGLGSKEHYIGERIHVHLVNNNGMDDRRSLTYARLTLTEDEEDSLVAWGLVPQRSNKKWWDNYRKQKASM